jgi:hypothetical protein
MPQDKYLFGGVLMKKKKFLKISENHQYFL